MRGFNAARVLAAVSYFDLEGLAAASIAHGNAFATLARNDRGGVSGFAWTPSERVTAALDERGRLFYRIAADTMLGEVERVVPASDVVHVKFRATGSTNRYLGVSPLKTCGPALAMALRAQQFQSEILSNVQAPSVYLHTQGKLEKEVADRFRIDWQQQFGPGGRGRTAVLGNGLEAKLLDISTAVDAELGKQFEFGVAEIARALGVPVSLLMQPGSVNYAQAVEETRAFAALSLQPYCARFADELGAKLLTTEQRAQGFAVEFDLTRLLVSPGEIAERMSKLVNGGVMTTNEARNQIGLADVEGGAQLRVPVNTERMSMWLTKEPAKVPPPANPETPTEEAEPELEVTEGMVLEPVQDLLSATWHPSRLKVVHIPPKSNGHDTTEH